MIPADWLNNDWQQDNARADVLLECRRDVKTKTLIVLSTDMPSQTVADTPKAPANCFGESFQISQAPICKFCNESRAILPTPAMSSGCYLTTMDRIGKYFVFNLYWKKFVSYRVGKIFHRGALCDLSFGGTLFRLCVTMFKYSAGYSMSLRVSDIVMQELLGKSTQIFLFFNYTFFGMTLNCRVSSTIVRWCLKNGWVIEKHEWLKRTGWNGLYI